MAFGQLRFTGEAIICFERSLRHQRLFWPVCYIDFVVTVVGMQIGERILAVVRIVISHGGFVFDCNYFRLERLCRNELWVIGVHQTASILAQCGVNAVQMAVSRA